MPRKRIALVGHKVWANLAVIALLFSVVPGIYLYLQNRHRIDDIQRSRLAFCVRTYEGIREVFKPFLPPPNATQTAKQRHDIRLFNQTVDKLKSKCSKQVKSKGEA